MREGKLTKGNCCSGWGSEKFLRKVHVLETKESDSDWRIANRERGSEDRRERGAGKECGSDRESWVATPESRVATGESLQMTPSPVNAVSVMRRNGHGARNGDALVDRRQMRSGRQGRESRFAIRGTPA